VLDEVGYLPIDQRGADLLFQVISQRYERGSIILTSNKAFNNGRPSSTAIVPSLQPCSTVCSTTPKPS
jgi:DNA replication protein DnaC